MDKLSVLVPIYNEEGTLEELVERIEASSCGEYNLAEIIFVDDGSRDESFAILKTIAKKNNSTFEGTAPSITSSPNKDRADCAVCESGSTLTTVPYFFKSRVRSEQAPPISQIFQQMADSDQYLSIHSVTSFLFAIRQKWFLSNS